MLNDSLHYKNNRLHCESVDLASILAEVGTPVYIYSARRALANVKRIRQAFDMLDAHVHFSVKSNASIALLRHLVEAGCGMDVVSAGEIHRALLAGTPPEAIVFAGVGKTPDELAYAIEQGVSWINVENVAECAVINDIARQVRRNQVRVALRLNPEVTPKTHPYIATGHGGAKFGLTAEAIDGLLRQKDDYPYIDFAGVHIHIGSQLQDVAATVEAVQAVLRLVEPYPQINTINIGGGLPVAYAAGDTLPRIEDFAQRLAPHLAGYRVLIEPGRSIVADAGLFVMTVLYVKRQAGQTFLITDGSMAELIRPALYGAHHTIVPLVQQEDAVEQVVQIAGPVCETADVMARDVRLPALGPGDPLVVLDAGAYGMVMASNYNQRPRPPEVVIAPDGQSWRLTRRRETWEDMLRAELS